MVGIEASFAAQSMGLWARVRPMDPQVPALLSVAHRDPLQGERCPLQLLRDGQAVAVRLVDYQRLEAHSRWTFELSTEDLFAMADAEWVVGRLCSVELRIDDTARQTISEIRWRTLEEGSVASGSTTPDTTGPSRDEVLQAMHGISSDVKACGSGGTQNVRVSLVFRGETGEVAEASVLDSEVTEDVNRCVERALHGARVPPFGREKFSVTYPFRI